MKNSDLFTALGIKIKENALPISFCNRLLEEIKKGKKEEVLKVKVRNDKQFRKTYKPKLPVLLQQQLLNKIKTSLQPELEFFFSTPLKPFEPIQFLYYDQGHFFKPHTDDQKTGNGSDYKKITVVIFLSEQSDEIGQPDFGGGNLNLYGLFKKNPYKPFPVPIKKGLMVAFKSDVIHEVTQIEWGHRCNLVIWFT